MICSRLTLTSTHHADVQGRSRVYQRSLRYARHHSLSEHTSLVTVSEIKYEAILLAVDCYFVISESGKAKDKGISLQLSDIAESAVRNMITGKQVQ